MASTFSWRLKKTLRLLTPLALLCYYFQIPGTLTAQNPALRHHFACSLGYTPQECQTATAVLRKAVTRYPLDELGEWTWILVRPVDWKRFLSTKGINPNDPAFSNLTKRKTFLDGSLVEAVSIRGIELRTVWRMSIEELLDRTIRHELAHAFCNERDEWKVDRIALTLKEGSPPPCRATPVTRVNPTISLPSIPPALLGKMEAAVPPPARHPQHHSDEDPSQASLGTAGNRPGSK